MAEAITPNGLTVAYPFTQQKYCCVPTCIQTVMYRGIPLIPAEVIGCELGPIVLKKTITPLFQVRSTGEGRRRVGTQIYTTLSLSQIPLLSAWAAATHGAAEFD